MARHALETGAYAAATGEEERMRRAKRFWIVAGVLVIVAVAVLAYPHIAAEATRRQVASEAVAVQAHAEQLMAHGETMAAYDLIHAALGRGVDTPELRAYYKVVSNEFILESARKAHVQHGAESTQGALAPEDIQR